MDPIRHMEMAIRIFGYPSAISGEKKLNEKEQVEAIKHVLACKEDRCRQAKKNILLTLQQDFEKALRCRGVFVIENGKPRRYLDVLREFEERMLNRIQR